MAFDLSAKLAGVSKLNTQQPKIEYLPFDLVDPNPDNFYSLERLDELADSIATVGLLDPIRVRPSGERYTVTSGHRRREAIKLLIDGGDERWREALPCIVDRGEATAEFRELQLIYANSATRQLSSSELSRQAERVEALLVALKEQGYEFPGRMQEHVAQAMSVKASKLKRLHAIRSNAQEYVLDAYDEGKINEATAYELQKLPQAWQKALMIHRIRAGTLPSLSALSVSNFVETAVRLTALNCIITPGTQCAYGQQRIEIALSHGATGGNCTIGGCCFDCRRFVSCEDACPKCESARREAQARIQEDEEREEAAQREADAEDLARCSAFWRRVRQAAEDNGVDLIHALTALDVHYADVDEMLDYARGDASDTDFVANDLLEDYLEELATELHCSTDYLLGRTDDPKPPAQRDAGGGVPCTGAPRPDDKPTALPLVWQTGKPEEKGCYAVRYKVSESAPGEIQSFSRWDGFQWRGVRSNKPVEGMIAVGWWRIPEV